MNQPNPTTPGTFMPSPPPQPTQWGRITMGARHRIRIIAAAIAVVALTGGRAAALEEPTPATDLGRAAQACIDANPDIAAESQILLDFYDDGLSVQLFDGAEECMLDAVGLPEWVGQAEFGGVLRFGDWSVMRGGLGDGPLWIMDNEVAPTPDDAPLP